MSNNIVLSMILAIVLIALTSFSQAFSTSMSRKLSTKVTMEYIPDGLSKSQWDAIKKRVMVVLKRKNNCCIRYFVLQEAEELKKKGNLGALGTTKFKSRSFEAWQKAGGKHLFPVGMHSLPLNFE